MNELFEKLAKSKFRKKFHLTDKDKDYIAEKSLVIIRQHATDLITKRLGPAQPKNDGKQTPYGGHPVFIAQHAIGACCRTCLLKWHGLVKDVELSKEQIQYIVNVIEQWFIRENLR